MRPLLRPHAPRALARSPAPSFFSGGRVSFSRRRILRSEPRRIFASGGQEVNHKSVDSDVLDSAYVIVDFQSGARAMLELCMFAEASKHQEEV